MPEKVNKEGKIQVRAKGTLPEQTEKNDRSDEATDEILLSNSRTKRKRGRPPKIKSTKKNVDTRRIDLIKKTSHVSFLCNSLCDTNVTLLCTIQQFKALFHLQYVKFQVSTGTPELPEDTIYFDGTAPSPDLQATACNLAVIKEVQNKNFVTKCKKSI